LILAVPRRHPGYHQSADVGLLVVHEKLALAEMLAFVKVLHRVDRRERNTAALLLFVEIEDLPFAEPISHQRLKCVIIASARETVAEELIVGPFRIPHELDKPLPLIFLDGEDENLAVGAIGDKPRSDQALA